MDQLKKMKLTFDREGYNSFKNYSLFLKHIKGTTAKSKSENESSKQCSFHELLDHLETLDSVDVFIFKVRGGSDVLGLISLSLKKFIFRLLLLVRLGLILNARRTGSSRLHISSSASSIKPQQVRNLAKKVRFTWIPSLSAMR